MIGGPGGRTAVLALLVAAAAPAPLAAQSWRTVTMSRQAVDEDTLDVEVSYGAGRFTVRPATGGLLYRMQVRYDEDVFEPRAEYDGRRLRLGLEGSGRDVRIGRHEGGEMELELSRSVPMALELDFGAVRADIDLGGLSLTDLDVRTGASDSRIDVSEPNPIGMRRADFQVGAADFTARRLGNLNAREIEVSAGVGDLTLELTGEWRQDAEVRVKMGLGSVQLRVPEGLGIKLERETFLTSLDADGLVERGDAYYSLDWEQATRHVTIHVEAAFGSIDVVRVR